MNLIAAPSIVIAPKLSRLPLLFLVPKLNKTRTQFSAWQWAGEGLDLTRPRLP